MCENIDFDKLWQVLGDQFELGSHSFHGPEHWRRVESNGLELAMETGNIDLIIVRLFAVFHDSRRENEGYDPEHGFRAAALAVEMRGSYFDLADSKFDCLVHALELHNDGKVSSDPNIGICWDADRLDLPRVGIIPDPILMSSEAGKQRARQFRVR